jgi:hypothetical protein
MTTNDFAVKSSIYKAIKNHNITVFVYLRCDSDIEKYDESVLFTHVFDLTDSQSLAAFLYVQSIIF